MDDYKQNFSFHFTVEEVILKASLEALVLWHEAPIVDEIPGAPILYCMEWGGGSFPIMWMASLSLLLLLQAALSVAVTSGFSNIDSVLRLQDPCYAAQFAYNS